MARIMIENLFKKTIVVKDHSKSLLSHFQDHQIDWMHSCAGKGRCTTCKVSIAGGEEHFMGMTVHEKRYYREGALKAHERLACQAKITGDVSLVVPREYQLPHMKYSDKA